MRSVSPFWVLAGWRMQDRAFALRPESFSMVPTRSHWISSATAWLSEPCSSNWRTTPSSSSFENWPHSRCAVLCWQRLWLASGWNSSGWSSPDWPVPLWSRKIIHRWWWNSVRKSRRWWKARQVHRGDTWENNNGHVPDRRLRGCRNMSKQ